MKKLITLVVPVFNEEENVMPLYERVTGVIRGIEDKYDFEFLFTDNHSEDRTFRILRELAARDPRVRVCRYSRNFGFQRSILTGYGKARGSCAIQMDCDMQDPPELILEFIRLWEQGYQVVYGVRRTRQEGWVKQNLRRLFYRTINWLSEDELPRDAGDFRLVDRCVLDELREMYDYQPYLRGTIAAMGFRQVGVPYDRPERARGESKFSWKELVQLSFDGILNHSVIPLRISSYLGIGVSLMTLLGSVVYIIGRFIYGQKWPAGFATITVIILLSLSVNALFLGIIGEYLGRIYQQVKRRPLTIIEEEIDAGRPDPRACGGPVRE